MGRRSKRSQKAKDQARDGNRFGPQEGGGCEENRVIEDLEREEPESFWVEGELVSTKELEEIEKELDGRLMVDRALKWKEGEKLPGRACYTGDSSRTMERKRAERRELEMAAQGCAPIQSFFQACGENSAKRRRMAPEEAMARLEEETRVGKGEGSQTTSIHEQSRLKSVMLYLDLRQDGHSKMSASRFISQKFWRKGDYLATKIREWAEEYLETGNLEIHNQGRHQKFSILGQEDISDTCKEWLRSQKSESRGPKSLKKFVEEEILDGQGQISEETCRKYLWKWGFRLKAHTKEVYFDGHEREDVQENRKDWVERMLEYEKKMSQFVDGEEREPNLEEGEKKIVQVTHDESCFYSNDGKKELWLEEGEVILRKKGEGRSYMVSGFLCPCHGGMSYKYIAPGKNRDGYWTSKEMIEHVPPPPPFFFYFFNE